MENNTKFYIYKHVKIINNEIFYIGIGTKNKNDIKYEYYTRANSKYNRNKYWKNIITKYKYKVEIIEESNNYEYIKNKEIELIKLYGRKDLKTGLLVNMTDGGDGVLGNILSEESKNKISISKKGKPYKGKIRTLYKYNLEGYYVEEINNIRKYCIKNNYKDSNLYKCASNIIKTSYGFIFKDFKSDKIDSQIIHSIDDKFKNTIYQYGKDFKLLKIHKGTSDLEKLGFLPSKISQCCSNDRNNHKGFVFSFSELSEIQIKEKLHPSKTIIQMDLSGNFIKEWNNSKEILEKMTEIKQLKNIYMCCNGTRKKAHGFKWKYAKWW